MKIIVSLMFGVVALGCIANAQDEEPEMADQAKLALPSEADRRKLPSNGCLHNYGSGCPNACAQRGSTCCWCEQCWQRVFGLTQTCSCCPRGYKCCPFSRLPPPFGGIPRCCPWNARCGPRNTCIVTQRARAGHVACSNCRRWVFPPRNATLPSATLEAEDDEDVLADPPAEE